MFFYFSFRKNHTQTWYKFIIKPEDGLKARTDNHDDVDVDSLSFFLQLFIFHFSTLFSFLHYTFGYHYIFLLLLCTPPRKAFSGVLEGMHNNACINAFSATLPHSLNNINIIIATVLYKKHQKTKKPGYSLQEKCVLRREKNVLPIHLHRLVEVNYFHSNN